MCVMKTKYDYCTKHKYGFVNPHLFFKNCMCFLNQKSNVCFKVRISVLKTIYGFWYKNQI